jgi:hypothetical protein
MHWHFVLRRSKLDIHPWRARSDIHAPQSMQSHQACIICERNCSEKRNARQRSANGRGVLGVHVEALTHYLQCIEGGLYLYTCASCALQCADASTVYNAAVHCSMDGREAASGAAGLKDVVCMC